MSILYPSISVHVLITNRRDESSKLPKRLTTLVQGYPYGSFNESDGLLTRPRFSTRRYPALLVQVDSELLGRNGKAREAPRRGAIAVVSDALHASAPPEAEKSPLLALWKTLVEGVSTNEDDVPDLTKLFTTETINFLGLSARSGEISPTTEALIVRPAHARGRSFSVDHVVAVKGPSITLPPLLGKSHEERADVDTSNVVMTTESSWTLGDWKDFSTTGFGASSGPPQLASTLLDSDIERTVPPASPTSSSGLLRRKSSKRGTSTPPGARGKTPKLSLDIPHASVTRAPLPTTAGASTTVTTAQTNIKAVKRVLVDEAFVDFWADALTDPIVTAQWPQFALCRLRTPLLLPSADSDIEERAEWLVLERTYSLPPLPLPPAPVPEASSTPGDSTPASATDDNHTRSRATSPRPSIEGKRVSSALSATKKRFSLFSRTSSSGGEKVGKVGKSAKSSNIGELGEVLAEEEERPVLVTKDTENVKENNGLSTGAVVTGVGVAAIGAGVGAAALADVQGADVKTDIVVTKEREPVKQSTSDIAEANEVKQDVNGEFLEDTVTEAHEESKLEPLNELNTAWPGTAKVETEQLDPFTLEQPTSKSTKTEEYEITPPATDVTTALSDATETLESEPIKVKSLLEEIFERPTSVETEKSEEAPHSTGQLKETNEVGKFEEPSSEIKVTLPTAIWIKHFSPNVPLCRARHT